MQFLFVLYRLLTIEIGISIKKINLARLPLALFFVLEEGVTDASSGRHLHRIVGGRPAKSGQIPYQVSLQKLGYFWGKSHYCGGTIISERCILTAGHCLIGYNPEDIVVQTDLQLDDKTGSKSDNTNGTYQAKELLPYPDYDHYTIQHDIGIIKLNSKITFDKNVQPIPLMEFKEEIPKNSICQISGWGYISEYGPVSKVLLVADIPIRNQSECSQLYDGQYKIYETMTCGGYLSGGTNSCYGDSGGPLVCHGKLAGITSFGIGCARGEYPGVYTTVSYYINWIKSHKCFEEIVEFEDDKILTEASIFSKILDHFQVNLLI